MRCMHGWDGYVRVVFLLEGGPHLGFPLVEIFFQIGIVIAFAVVEHPGGAQLLQLAVGQLAHAVEVLILFVTEAEYRVEQVREGWRLVLVGDKLVEGHSIVCGLTLAVGGHQKHCELFAGDGR